MAKKRQTFGKIQRERERAEKRARKLERREERKAEAAALAEAEALGLPLPGAEDGEDADAPEALDRAGEDDDETSSDRDPTVS